MERYDTIGRGYARRRQPEPRIAARIEGALGDARTVVNVGAGAGSYEPTSREVLAVEPSQVMIDQRPPDAAPAIRASATDLPFPDDHFDAALAVLTVHHWPDSLRGLRELRRVARGPVVIFAFDTSVKNFWLFDYFAEMSALDERNMPRMPEVMDALGGATISPVLIPHDCRDGFLGAYWRQPEAYLDPDVRSAISTFSLIGEVEPGLERLRADLDSGEWNRRYGDVLERDELDLGYRLIVG